ncbi:MAG: hypothetical protein HQL30_06745 [Candidatus Omnitrophica bacterium]|nr:hypothetical protein [Candidatus Omnitrophota bacterium]
MKKLIFCFFLCFAGFVPNAMPEMLSQGMSQAAVNEMRTKATDNLTLAREFTGRGQELLKTGLTRDNLKIAGYLYMEAGKLYEQSNFIYQKVLDKGSAQMCESSLKTCIDVVRQCKQKEMELTQKKRQ